MTFRHPMADLMDANGMLPAHPCKVCRTPLDTTGNRPAELYAGTYTGLCYACERGVAFIEHTYRDGAQRWSFPPHSPSWRRERESFIGFPDCTDQRCGGRGRLIVARYNAMGGSYPAQCTPCAERFYGEPLRAESSSRWIAIMANQRVAWAAADKTERKRLRLKRSEPMLLPPEVVTALNDEYKMAYQQLKEWESTNKVFD